MESASTPVYTTSTVQTEVLAQERQLGQERQPSQDTEVASQSTPPDTSVYTTIIVQTEVPIQESQNSNSVQAPAQLPPLPIEPDRPEAIYSKYRAAKEAWCAAHPNKRPSKYRSAIGLKS